MGSMSGSERQSCDRKNRFSTTPSGWSPRWRGQVVEFRILLTYRLSTGSAFCGVPGMLRRHLVVVIWVLCVILLPRTAWANILAPTLVPGMAPLFGALAIPATILAALCESPFVRRAGIQRQPLFHSFNANLASTFVGFLLMPIGLPILFTIPGVWELSAIALSIWIEGAYYRKACVIPAGQLRWSPLIWGNLGSTAILIAVSWAAHMIETPYRARRIESLWWPLLLLTVAGGVAGFLFGLRRALKTRKCHTPGRKPSASSDDRRAHTCHGGQLAPAPTPAVPHEEPNHSTPHEYPMPSSVSPRADGNVPT
jgi:hypothetical protein